ncbi:ASCH domain-containing protein [Flavobacteriaceae bacterium KMM 6897]|nr:ASCH domain-containing protein [Flavobacteriaceae bacterium KMM 6897]MEB8346433.1 ASCH domain-containing protein [Flavobacteriaceae bacterium KMM 6898]
MDNSSARSMWGDFLSAHLEFAFEHTPTVYHFSDNEKDANQSVALVLAGVKKATSHSLLGLQLQKKELPKRGDFSVLTDWDGKAKCIVRTTTVRMVPYFSINAEYTKIEGDGDGSLSDWKKIHWELFQRELAEYDRKPNESMIVVCEHFEKVF